MLQINFSVKIKLTMSRVADLTLIKLKIKLGMSNVADLMLTLRVQVLSGHPPDSKSNRPCRT
jgi:hypothetical protein